MLKAISNVEDVNTHYVVHCQKLLSKLKTYIALREHNYIFSDDFIDEMRNMRLSVEDQAFNYRYHINIVYEQILHEIIVGGWFDEFNECVKARNVTKPLLTRKVTLKIYSKKV